jgi:hypothetical protein
MAYYLRNRPENTLNADILDLRFLVEIPSTSVKLEAVTSLSSPVTSILFTLAQHPTFLLGPSFLHHISPSSATSMSDVAETNGCLDLDDVALVRPLLDEFKSAKRGERKHVVRKGLTAVMAARNISHLQPLAQGKIIAQVKEASFSFSQFNCLIS